MRTDNSVHLDESLRVLAGLESAHPSLSFSSWLVRVLSPIVQVPVVSVINTRHHHPFCRSVAAELVSNDDARHASSRSQELAKEEHGCEAITLSLDQNVENNAMLIDGSPKVVSDAVDFEKDLVQMPLVTRAGTPSPQAISELLAELVAPAPDCFVAHQHATC